MTLMLMLKIVLAPVLIGLASWVGRRWGPAVGGWFAALPLTSGPVILVIAIERGPAFAAQASVGTLLALISLCAFAVVYAWMARWLHWSVSCLAGCAAYLACTWALRPIALPLVWVFACVCAVLLAAIWLMPVDPSSRRAPPVVVWDIPLRMALAALLVWGLTQAAGYFGPRVSGLLTPFPVAVTILASFTQHLEGPAAAAQLLRSLLVGLFTFAVFFLVLGAGLVPWGLPLAFTSALLAALTCHAGAWFWLAQSRQGDRDVDRAAGHTARGRTEEA